MEKKDINRLSNYRQIVESISWIVFILLFLLFTQAVWETAFITYFVNEFITPIFKQSYIVYAFYFALVLIIIIHRLKFCWLRKPNKYSFIILFVFAILYYSNRYAWVSSNYTWDFLPVKYRFKFLDAIVIAWLLASLPIVYYIKSFFQCLGIIKKQEKESNSKALQSDSLKINIDEDKLDRSKFAKKICDKIISIENNDSFSIGIEAEWGEGKSTFLQFIKENLTKDNQLAYIIEFSPYDSFDSKNMIIDLFSKLEKKLKPVNPNIVSALRKYAKLLTGFRAFGFSFSFLPFKPQEILSASKKKIGDAIEQLDKPVVILIDELDRVEKPEILAVLQMIAQTAHFKNTVFVTAYCSRYVTSALKDIDEAEIFLEKFFNLSYTLPKPSKAELKKESKDLLIKTLGEGNVTEIEKFINNFNGSYNLRTIKRLANSTYSANDFILSKESGENICLYDLLLIQLLELLSPNVHRTLGNSPFLFLELHNYNNNSSSYSLPNVIPNDFELNTDSSFAGMPLRIEKANMALDIDKKGSDAWGNKELDKHEYIKVKIKPHCKSESYTLSESIYEILQLLFEESEANDNHIRIKNPIRFNEYFYKQLGEKQISEKDFSDLLYSSENVEDKVNEWLSNGKEESLKIWVSQFKVEIENVERLYKLAFCEDDNYENKKELQIPIAIPYFNIHRKEYSKVIANKIVEIFKSDGYLKQKIKMLSNFVSKYNFDGIIFLENSPELLSDCLKLYWKKEPTHNFTEINHMFIFHELRNLANNSQNKLHYTPQLFNELRNSFKYIVKNNIKNWYEYLITESNGEFRLNQNILDFKEHKSFFNSSKDFETFLNEIKYSDESLFEEFYKFYETYKIHDKKTGDNLAYIEYIFEKLTPERMDKRL